MTDEKRYCTTMLEKEPLTVEIDRISNSGNPIAELPDGGHLIVFGGAVDDTVRVRIKHTLGIRVGEIVHPTPEQKERAERHLAKRKVRYEEQRQKKKNGKDDHQTAREESKGPNKNSLINGHL